MRRYRKQSIEYLWVGDTFDFLKKLLYNNYIRNDNSSNDSTDATIGATIISYMSRDADTTLKNAILIYRKRTRLWQMKQAGGMRVVIL
jgi:hypothetical protein